VVDDFFLDDVLMLTKKKKTYIYEHLRFTIENYFTLATLIPLQKSVLPSIGNRCNFEKTFPTSLVN